MWEKFVKFMTGPFAGATALWDVIEQRMHEASVNTTIDALIEELIKTHPMVTTQMAQFSGAKVRRHSNQMRCHAIPIGKDLWVGMQIAISERDYCKIFICEDQEADVDEATIVYWSKVRIPGHWQNDIKELLMKAIDDAYDLKSLVDSKRAERDETRANSPNFSRAYKAEDGDAQV